MRVNQLNQVSAKQGKQALTEGGGLKDSHPGEMSCECLGVRRLIRQGCRPGRLADVVGARPQVLERL